MQTKKIWITDKGDGLYSISFESRGNQLHEKLHVTEYIFPAIKADRHSVNIGLLDDDDLVSLRDCIDKLLIKL